MMVNTMETARPTQSPVSPFVPGTGASPPILAGRESHKRRLEDLCLRLTETRVGAHRPAVLIGPRGNGKTVLLNWLEERATPMGIDIIWATPDQVPSIDALAEKLGASDSGRLEAAKASGQLGSEVLGGAGGSLEFKLRQLQRHSPPDLTAILQARASRRPFALLLDEAHTLSVEVGRALLNATQIASKRAPLLLAMAGTPDLRDALGEMSATFWGRAMKVGVGLLSEEDVVTAIADPLGWNGISLAGEEAWAHVTADSQGYPYFVQTWGEELWRHGRDLRDSDPLRAKEGRVVLSEAEVKKAGGRVSVEKNDYYGDRYEELGKLGVLGPARAVAAAFASQPAAAFSWEALTEIARREIDADKQADDVLQHLSHVGFVWRSPDTNGWRPGIPSLMSYVLERCDDQDNQPPGSQGTSPGQTRKRLLKRKP